MNEHQITGVITWDLSGGNVRVWRDGHCIGLVEFFHKYESLEAQVAQLTTSLTNMSVEEAYQRKGKYDAEDKVARVENERDEAIENCKGFKGRAEAAESRLRAAQESHVVKELFEGLADLDSRHPEGGYGGEFDFTQEDLRELKAALVISCTKADAEEEKPR